MLSPYLSLSKKAVVLRFAVVLGIGFEVPRLQAAIHRWLGIVLGLRLGTRLALGLRVGWVLRVRTRSYSN